VGGAGTLISDAVNPLQVGNYEGTGTFHAVIGTSGPALSVTGGATLIGGGIFVNTVNVDGTLSAGASFTALSTGSGITGDFASIADSSALFDFTGMIVGNDYILTTIAGMAMTDVAETDNQREVAGALEGLGGTPSDPDLADVVSELGMLDEAGVRAAYDALAGEINADMPTAPIANAQLFQGSVFDRLGTLRGVNGQSAFSLGQLALDEAGATPEISVASAMIGADAPAATGVWVRAHGLLGEVDGDEDGTGAHDLDHSTGGLMAGYDWALSEATVVGVGAGYAHSTLDLDAVEQEGEIDSFRIAAYGGTRTGALSVRGLVGYAYHDNSTERHIIIGGFDETAEGDYVGHELSAAGEVGYLMSLGGVALEPVAGLGVTHLSDEGYEESGAGGAGLEIDGRSTTSLRSTLGARASFAPAGNFRLSASLAWAHEWADTDRVADAQFLGGGAAFQIQGAEVSRDSALVGVGVGVVLGQGIDLTVGYDGQFGADDTAHGAEARLKIGL
jgi:outer membrane autotransporter protein